MKRVNAGVLIAAMMFFDCASQKPEAKIAASAPPAHAHEAHNHEAHDHENPSLTLTSLAEGALLLGDLGTHQRKITTTSPEAQAYFTQGLQLTYGFNHDEAARSYAKAAQLDPSCAMCFWGVALTLGPNYNVPMLPDRAQAAWDALQKAQATSANSTSVEKALIGALAKRYGGPQPLPPEGMAPFSRAYSDAMREVAKQFGDDDDVQVLFAESLMTVRPWQLWSLDGQPAEGTQDILDALQRVLKRSPNHPGANHYYIHAIEASPTPQKGEAVADRLRTLVPGAGHMVHMPAHIYQRVGRYEDAALQNRKAVQVDEAYIAKAKPFGYYPIYLGHNYGFLAFADSMEGRKDEALKAARESAKATPKAVVCSMPGMDYFVAIPYFTMVRFGSWDDMLNEPRPEAKYQVQTGLWLHGRGMAQASTNKVDEAKQTVAELRTLLASLPDDLMAGFSTAKNLLELSAKVVDARIADRTKAPDALSRWAEAVAIADKLPYAEPADWFYPLRHYQGAALMQASHYEEAEAVYREDLRRNPKNAWSLYGLTQALKKQKKSSDAAKIEKEFKAASARADMTFTTSAF